MWTLLLWCALAWAGDFRFAVADFTDGGDDPALSALGQGLAAMVITDLAQASAIDIVEREQLDALLAEQDLGESDRVDPDTAAELGRIVSATHFVTGAYTVLSDQMRIDLRVVDVEDGSVVLTTKVEGEKDAFFELEKDLVKQIIGAVRLELSARERAELGRLHTADFEAFSLYSEGLELYDEEKYQSALEKLREAAGRDQSFSLARITLETYEQLIEELESRADAIESARLEVAELEAEGAFADELEVRRLLLEKSESSDLWDRLVALQLLAVGHDEVDFDGPHFVELAEREDAFLLASQADQYIRAYLVAARPLWPDVSLLPYNIPRLQFPRAATFDADFEEVKRRMQAPTLSERRDTIPRLQSDDGQRTGLDRAAQARLIAELVDEAPDVLSDKAPGRAADELRSALLLDESTRVWQRLAEQTADEEELRDIAEEVALNRDMRKILEQSPADSLAPEALRMYWTSGSSTVPLAGDKAELYGSDPTPPEAFRQIRAKRKVRYGRYKDALFVNDIQIRFGGTQFESDPRTDDARRASALRYYRHENPQGRISPAVLGYSRSNERALTLALDYTIPDQWIPGHVYPSQRAWDGKLHLVEDRPTVHVLLGLRWLEPHETDREARIAEPPRYRKESMTGLSLRIRPGDVTLLQITERVDERQRGVVDVEELSAPQKLKAADRRELTIQISPDEVVVRGAGKPIRFSAEVPEGYLGLDAVGLGYVSLEPSLP